MSESPVTFGQKSVLRAEHRVSADANRDFLVSRVHWAIPAPAGVNEVRDALVSLALRHEALRTTFHDVLSPEPVQVVTDETYLPPSIGDGDRCWGARFVDGPSGCRLELTLHRVIADEASVNLFMSELKTIVAGGSLRPGESPRWLAARQRSAEWRKRRSAAARHWEHTVDQVADVRGPSPPPTTGHAVIAFATIPAAEHRLVETADELGLSPGGLATMVLARVLPPAPERDRIVITVQFANRSEPGLDLMLGNQSQAVPLVFGADEVRGAAVDLLAETTRWKLVHAQRHGMHDPDVPRALGWDDLPGRHLITYTEGPAFGSRPAEGIRRGVFSRPHPGVHDGIVVSLKNLGGHLSLGMRGDTGQWSRGTMSLMLDRFVDALLGRISPHP